jgi:DNA-binding transcriptional ArsR family regulator
MSQAAALDHVFQALGDATRRAVIARLCQGPLSVTELAAPFEMALPSFVQHLRVLEDSGLIGSKKVGRVRTCHVKPKQLTKARHWLDAQRLMWEQRLNQLDDYLKTMKAGAA